MDKEALKEAKRLANEIKPAFNVGKSGVTDTFVDTIDKYLEAHRIVKIKCLGAESKDEVAKIADKVAKDTDSEIISKVGFTFVLYRQH